MKAQPKPRSSELERIPNRFLVGQGEYVVTLEPDGRQGIWQRRDFNDEDVRAVLLTGPATINESEVLLLRPRLKEAFLTPAEEEAFLTSRTGLPMWTRTDIVLDLDIAGDDVDQIHVIRCRDANE